MDTKPDENAAPSVIDGRINGRFAGGFWQPWRITGGYAAGVQQGFPGCVGTRFQAHGEQVLARSGASSGCVFESLRNVGASELESSIPAASRG